MVVQPETALWCTGKRRKCVVLHTQETVVCCGAHARDRSVLWCTRKRQKCVVVYKQETKVSCVKAKETEQETEMCCGVQAKEIEQETEMCCGVQAKERA